MADPRETRSAAAAEAGPRWGLAAALALLALMLLLVVMRQRPPAAKPDDAPAAEFSAGRARQILQELVGDGQPHPTGSPANARVRDRIVAELRGLGYTPEVQRAFACTHANCAWVENVIARLSGREPGGAVLLMAHYDSVPAGPGASDDGAGVATVLEIARILKSGPPPRHDVILLLDDAEELGLLGAEVFTAQHPAAREVKAVINVEARGSRGPSLMFETSGAAGWLVSRFVAGASRPLTSSVFAAIYDRLPNDTDLSVFKRRGVPGLNFAYIGGPAHYHTTADTFANASPASLQHHGDNALAAVRAAAEADLRNLPPQGNLAFFDVLSLFVLRWPLGWTPGLAVLALLLVAVAVWRALRRGGTIGQVLFGLLGFVAVIVAGGLAAFLLNLVLNQLGAYGNMPWVASPLPYSAAFWLLALAAVAAAAALLGRRAGILGFWAGVWLGWAVLGLLVSFAAPGVGYLFVVPALVAGLAGLALGRREGGGWALAALLPSAVAGLLWFPVLLPLDEGLGVGAFFLVAVLLAVLLTSLAPLVPVAGPVWRRWVPVAAAVLALIFAGVAYASPKVTPESPRSLGIQFHQDLDTGKARWLVRAAPPLPDGLRQAAAFEPQAVPPFPWSFPWGRAFVAPAPAAALPGPALTVSSDSVTGGKRRLRLYLTSPRGAKVATVAIPKGARLESLALGGTPLELEARPKAWPPGFDPDYRLFTHSTLPPEGAELEAVLGNAAALDWYVVDSSPGLPPGGEKLVGARPDTAVSFQDGDVTLVSRKVKI